MPYSTCAYLGRDGICGKRCIAGLIGGDRCGVHKGKTPLSWCAKGCGRGTRSKCGLCSKCGQNDGLRKLRQQAKRKEAHIAEVLAFIRENPELVAAAAAAREDQPSAQREKRDAEFVATAYEEMPPLEIEPDAE